MHVIWIALAVGAVTGAGHGQPASDPGAPIDPTSRVWITGASNIRRFTCRARQIDGTLSLHGVATSGPLLSGVNAASEPSLRVAVDLLECGPGTMNDHVRDILGASEHPVIAFRLTSYDVDLTGDAPVARITGEVSVAGVTRPVATSAALLTDSLGRLHVRGTHVVRMSEFGLEPPRRFGGLLRVRDRITVHFDVVPGHDGGATDVIHCATHGPPRRSPLPE